MSDAFLVDAVRTPVGLGKPEKGALYSIAPVDLLSLLLRALIDRAQLDPAAIEDVIIGCVTPIRDQGANIGRLSVLQAGFPATVPGIQLNRMCGSGQQAVNFAAQAVLAGDMDLIIAGGVEMMSHQPLGADYPEAWPENLPYEIPHQGISAELMAEKWALTREELDDYAYQSHLRAGAAMQAGRFEGQIIPVPVPSANGPILVQQDQGVRIPPDREKMAALKPVFKPDGVITAGNASQISDGAAVLLVASEEALHRHNLQPMARIVARGVAASDPVLMLDAPIPATHDILRRSGMRLGDPDGGAIALGHPLGATGAVLMTKLVHAMKQDHARYGLQAMCIGHGMATASILERC